jgi:mannose-6-phosphate isomerase-like protein (cupin superfamily)
MESGDSVYFDSSAPHSYQATGDATARAIVITTPPRV